MPLISAGSSITAITNIFPPSGTPSACAFCASTPPAGSAPVGGAPEGAPESAYEYPVRADELIEKRILEGKMEEAKRQIDGLIRGASAYQPTVLRPVGARRSSPWIRPSRRATVSRASWTRSSACLSATVPAGSPISPPGSI